jgi:hypothetical protein
MVADRSAERLLLYVDGIERASAPAPNSFGPMINRGNVFRAGLHDAFGGGTGPADFPGVIDEIRVSSTAHSAARIASDFNGDGPLFVTSYGPREIARSKAASVPRVTAVTVDGYNLENVTARVVRNGQPLAIGVTIAASTYRRALLNLAVSPSVPLGPAQLVISKPGQPDASLAIQVTEQSEFSIEPDTVLLWSLDETGNGGVRVADSGLLSIDGTAGANSNEDQGRFGRGRSAANIAADSDFGALAFAATSFTLECWIKTNPVNKTYLVAGKTDSNGNTNSSDFNLKLLPSGALQGAVINTAGLQWKVEMPHTTYVVDDNEWHSIAMVVDRSAERLLLYVDGVERATAAAPNGFGPMINRGNVFRAGLHDASGGGTGPADFPGVIDEIRVSSTAHSAAQIAGDFIGSDGLRVTRVAPPVIQKGSSSVPVTVFGHGLIGAQVAPVQTGVTLTVESTTPTRIDLTVSISVSVPIGPIQLEITDPLGQKATAEMTVVNQEPFPNTDAGTETIVLWRLDETGDGGVPIAGSGDSTPTVIGGTASLNSIARLGRFSGGRERAAITADSSSISALALAQTSFTVEGWVKTNPVTKTYILAGKADSNGSIASSDFNLKLLPSGVLQATVINTAGVQWRVETPRTIFDSLTRRWLPVVDDGGFHLVSMVVDRTAEKMSIYVDGVERANAIAPAGFGAMVNRGHPLRVGLHDASSPGSGPAEFPGILDEIRILNFARTGSQIRDTWLGSL